MDTYILTSEGVCLMFFDISTDCVFVLLLTYIVAWCISDECFY